MYKITLLLLCTVILSISHAQDKIHRKNGKVVDGKVIEIGSSDVKYKEKGDPDGPVYVLETDRISKIVFENGKVQKFTDDIKDPERYEGQLKKAIKIDFLGPLLGYSAFSFEKSTGVGKSYELTLGIIGAGKNSNINYYDDQFRTVRRKQFGFFVSGGYKFGKLPDFLIFGKTRLTHVMQGTYIKPLVYLGNYSENRILWKGNNTYEVGRQNVTFGALQVELGRQWVFSDKFLLDVYSGLGYAMDNKKDAQEYQYSYMDNSTAYNYANVRLGRSPGLSYTIAVKLGILLK